MREIGVCTVKSSRTEMVKNVSHSNREVYRVSALASAVVQDIQDLPSFSEGFEGKVPCCQPFTLIPVICAYDDLPFFYHEIPSPVCAGAGSLISAEPAHFVTMLTIAGAMLSSPTVSKWPESKYFPHDA